MWPMTRALYPGLNDENQERPGTADSHKTWYGNRRKSYASTYYGLGHQFSVRTHDTQADELEQSHHEISHQYSVKSTATQDNLGDLINRSQHVLSVLSEGGSAASPTSPASATRHQTISQQWPLPDQQNEWQRPGTYSGRPPSHQYTVSALSPSVSTVPDTPWSRPSTGIYSTHSTITGISSPMTETQTQQWSSNASGSIYSGIPHTPSVAETASASAYNRPTSNHTTRPESQPVSQQGSQPRTSQAGSHEHPVIEEQPESYSYHDGGFPTAEGYSQIMQQPDAFEQPYDTRDPNTLDPRQYQNEPGHLSVDISDIRTNTRGSITPVSDITVAAAGEPDRFPEKGSESTQHLTQYPDGPSPGTPRGYTSDGSGGPPNPPSADQQQGQPEEEEEDDDPNSLLTGLPLIAVTVALSAAVFLVAMDVNVIATAIPRITGEFRSLDDIGWYGSAFLMATCATQIPYGRIYTIFPAKWVFVSAIFIFMGGSLIAALSPSSPVLIFGRAVQGVGTSGILSGGLIIMSQVVALRLRPVLSGVIGAMEGVAMISAPIIGGVLTDKLHWRWCFYINLPIGGFVLLVVLFCLRIPKSKQKGPKEKLASMTWLQTLRYLDLIGAVALIPPIVCTLLALHYAGRSLPPLDVEVNQC